MTYQVDVRNQEQYLIFNLSKSFILAPCAAICY